LHIGLPLLGAVLAAIATIAALFANRVASSREATYELNRRKTSNLVDALAGRIEPTYPNATDYTVNHCVEPFETPDGTVVWASAGRLSNEAVSGVLSAD
jgi:hypothetical protein